MKKRQVEGMGLLISILSMIASLSACKPQDYTLHFKEEMVLDYKSENNTISLIERIGDTEIKEEHIKNNTIELNNFIVTCDSVDTSKVGEYEVTYVTNSTEDRLFTKKIAVKDISPPKITFIKETLELTLREYEKYDFSKQIKVTDNSDVEPSVIVKINEKVKEGKSYKIVVEAEDEKGNKSDNSFTLKIKKEPKPKPIETPPPTQYEEPSNPPSNNNTPSITPPANPPKEEKPKPKPPTSNSSGYIKDFLFTQGYTMDNVASACQSELFSSGRGGTCTPLTDSSGIYIGMRLEVY